MCYSFIEEDTGGWAEILNLVSGALCVGVGVASMIVGHSAEKKLTAAKAHVASEGVLRDAFESADEFGDGKLPPERVATMLLSMDPPTLLNREELMAAIRLMDADSDGNIGLDELLAWCVTA